MIVKRLRISDIRLDFQPEEYLDRLIKVPQFVAAMKSGERFPPVIVYHDGEVYWLYDGFHRIAALVKCKRRTVFAEIVRGTYAEMDAEWKRGFEAQKADWRASRQVEMEKANERTGK
jgi:hypothetical protein